MQDEVLQPPRALGRRQFLVAAGGAIAAAAAGVGSWRLVDWLERPRPSVRGYVSRPDLAPPVFDVHVRRSGHASGTLLLAPATGPGQHGALIADDGGRPVWFRPAASGGAVMNLRVQTYRGEPVLTWWEGRIVGGYGVGEYVIADGRYRTIARLRAGAGYAGDLHELQLTPQGTALVTVQRKRDGVVDSGIQEIDVATGRVLLHWSGLGRIALDESYAARSGGAYDYLHVNSIDVGADGNLLVSARHTWALYELDRGDGRILARIGGKRSDYTLGREVQFAWQHDARWRGPNTITLFDDGAQPKVEPQSRGLVLAVDRSRGRVELVRDYIHRPGLLAIAEGSMETLSNGNVLLGWGTEPWVTEFTPDGKVVFDGRFRGGGTSYRAFRAEWTGRPLDAPAVAAQREDDGVWLWASWNGSTETAAWSARDRAGRELRRVSRSGFETRIHVHSAAHAMRVAALDAKGRVLAVSRLVDTSA